MKKHIIIMCAIWTHRSNVFFNGANCNPGSIIESARKIFNETSIYEKTMVTNTSPPNKTFTIHRWTPA